MLSILCLLPDALSICAAAPATRRSAGGNRRVPEALKDMVSRCWDADYDKRPEMTEVIAILQKVRCMLGPRCWDSWDLLGFWCVCRVLLALLRLLLQRWLWRRRAHAAADSFRRACDCLPRVRAIMRPAGAGGAAHGGFHCNS